MEICIGERRKPIEFYILFNMGGIKEKIYQIRWKKVTRTGSFSSVSICFYYYYSRFDSERCINVYMQKKNKKNIKR